MVNYTPIAVNELPQKTTGQIDEASALVMISEVDTENLLSSYTVKYSDLAETIANIANNIQGTPTIFYNVLDLLDIQTITITVTSKMVYYFVCQNNVNQGTLTINFEVDSLIDQAYQLNLVFVANEPPTHIILQLNGETKEEFDLPRNVISTAVGTIKNDYLVTSPPQASGDGFTNTFVGLDDVDIQNPVNGQFVVYDDTVDPLKPFVNKTVFIPQEIQDLLNVQITNPVSDQLLAVIVNLDNTISIINVDPNTAEVTYESVLFVFAPGANNTNIAFGVYVDPLSGLNKITLNFDTTPLQQSITAAIDIANQYTDEQIALIGTAIPTTNTLTTITIPNQNFSNNPTNQWTSLAAYQGNGPRQVLQPTNNYVLNYTFVNGKIIGNAGNTGVTVPTLTTDNINLYMMCPIVLDNSLLTADYIFVSINLTITNGYTGPNTVANQAFNIYFNTAQLNYLNHIQATGVPAPIAYKEFSPAPFTVGNSWVITRTFAVNNKRAVLVANTRTITFPYNAKNFCGAPNLYPPVDWANIGFDGLGTSNERGPYGVYYQTTNLWTQQYTKFATALLPDFNTKIQMNYDFSTVRVGPSDGTKQGGDAQKAGIYNACWLFLDTTALSNDYITVELTINYRAKFPLTTNSGWTETTFDIPLAIQLGVPGNSVPTFISKPITILSKPVTTAINGTNWNVLGIVQGVFKKTIYVSRTTWTDTNPNNAIFIRDAGDVNFSSDVDDYGDTKQVLWRNIATGLIENKNINDITWINYGEPECSAQFPDYVPGTGLFTGSTLLQPEVFVLEPYNYNISLTSYYFVNISAAREPANFIVQYDNFLLTESYQFNLRIDNSFLNETITINLGSFLSVPSSSFPETDFISDIPTNIATLIIPAHSIGYFYFIGSLFSFTMIGSSIVPVIDYIDTTIGYMEVYTNNVNSRWKLTGYYNNYTSLIDFDENWARYPNVNETPNFLFGGDPHYFNTFFPSHPSRDEFWKFKDYTFGFSPLTAQEGWIQDANENLITPKNNLYVRFARIKMQLPASHIVDVIYNTENTYEREMGYLRRVMIEDPTNLLNYIDQMEIYGWDGAKNKVYLTFMNGETTYDILPNFVNNADNLFSFVQNIQRSQSLLPDPYYAITPKDYSQQFWIVNADNTANPTTNRINSKVNIDRPPIFFQGLFNLTFDLAGQLTQMLFVKPFDNVNFDYPTTFVYPKDLFSSNYTNFEDTNLAYNLKVLTDNADLSFNGQTYLYPKIVSTKFSGFIDLSPNAYSPLNS